MKLKVLIVASACVLASASAYCQTATPAEPPAATTTETPAVATPDAQNPNAPVKGENSFTESQAKERFEEAGYAKVEALKLDDDGIWHASAIKDGASVGLRLDYQGNITSEVQ